MSNQFDGFVPPTKNYFPMPNNWIDICADIDSMAELKVIQYVLRHTWGFHEFGITKTITTEEFMHGRKRNDGTRIDNGTGLKSDRSVKDGIKAAIAHGYLICEVDDSDKARIKKSYALKMSDIGQVDTTPPVDNSDVGQVDTTHLTGRYYPSDMQNLPIGDANTTYRTEKDTIERHLGKTPKKESTFVNSASAEVDAPAAITDLHEWKTESAKMRAMPKGQHEHVTPTDDSVLPDRQRGHADRADSDSAGPAGLEQTTRTGDSGTTPVQRSELLPPGIPASLGAAQGGKKRTTKKPVEPIVLKSDTREVQRRINEHRGYALEDTGLIINECNAIKTWCALHTIEEFGLVMAGAKKDKYWGKTENYYRIGGAVLLKITPEILARQRAPLQMVANGNGHSDLVEWQGQWMTVEQADELGYNGGFGLYK